MEIFLGLAGFWLVIMWIVGMFIPILLLLSGIFLVVKIIGNVNANNERQRYRD